MSNDDLKKVNNRDQLERNYKNNNSKIKKASIIVASTAATLGSMIALKNNGKAIIDAGKTIVHNRRYKQLKLW